METETIFCSRCGVPNPLSAETCLSCQQEIVRPHPIQLAGGEIYMLRCSKCGQRLPVVKISGTVTCTYCNMVHSIEPGQGYLTVRAAPGLAPTFEDAYEMGAPAPVASAANLELSPEQKALAAKQAKNKDKINEINAEIQNLNQKLKKRKQVRSTGLFAFLFGIALFIWLIIDTTNFYILDKVTGPVTFSFAGSGFLIGLIVLLATGKGKDRRLEAEIEEKNSEINKLEVETQGTSSGHQEMIQEITQISDENKMRQKTLEDRRHRRTAGLVMFLTALVAFVPMAYLFGNVLRDISGPLVFTLWVIYTLTGLILILATPKRKDEAIKAAMDDNTQEIKVLQNKLDAGEEQEGEA